MEQARPGRDRAQSSTHYLVSVHSTVVVVVVVVGLQADSHHPASQHRAHVTGQWWGGSQHDHTIRYQYIIELDVIC